LNVKNVKTNYAQCADTLVNYIQRSGAIYHTAPKARREKL